MTYHSCERERPLIIVVEDDQGNAHLLKTILQEEAQCQTNTYQNGEQVLDQLEEIAQRHPALFLIDYTLPGIHGLALYQHLHAREEMKNVPAVLLTGSARPEVLQEAEQRKICVLLKPFDLDQLLDLIERETTPSEQFS